MSLFQLMCYRKLSRRTYLRGCFCFLLILFLNNIVYSTWSKFEKGVSKKKSYCVCLCPLSSLSSVQTIMVPYRTVFEQSVLLCFEGEHFEGYQWTWMILQWNFWTCEDIKWPGTFAYRPKIAYGVHCMFCDSISYRWVYFQVGHAFLQHVTVRF